VIADLCIREQNTLNPISREGYIMKCAPKTKAVKKPAEKKVVAKKAK
jgi:hypothetical protein